MVWVWLITLIASIVVEFLTLGFVSIWFAFGALVAMILSLFPAVSPWIQIAVFAVVSVLSFVFLRKYLVNLFKGKQDLNAKKMFNKKVRMLTTADFDTLGTAKIDDVIWTIKSEDGSVLEAGEIVEIVGLEGNKYIAKKVS
ncbi:MAG: NfeD family protein [Clostridia bacterium]|nr:NfeD family protein [Clostridia bacterium]